MVRKEPLHITKEEKKMKRYQLQNNKESARGSNYSPFTKMASTELLGVYYK